MGFKKPLFRGAVNKILRGECGVEWVWSLKEEFPAVSRLDAGFSKSSFSFLFCALKTVFSCVSMVSWLGRHRIWSFLPSGAPRKPYGDHWDLKDFLGKPDADMNRYWFWRQPTNCWRGKPSKKYFRKVEDHSFKMLQKSLESVQRTRNDKDFPVYPFFCKKKYKMWYCWELFF